MIQLIFTGYILLVIFLSLIHTAALVVGIHSDKLAHFLAYGVMGVLAYLSVESKQKKAYLFFLVVSLGAVLEFLQFYISGRSASFFDMSANTIGVFVGYLAAWVVISGILNKLSLKEELPSNTTDARFSSNLEKAP